MNNTRVQAVVQVKKERLRERELLHFFAVSKFLLLFLAVVLVVVESTTVLVAYL